MIRVIASEKFPIKLWLSDLEPGAEQQAKNLANLPFIFKHVAIMPDSHQGYGMPIGGVLATNGVIVPNAVGVDIGCGMCALRTNLQEIEIDRLKKILAGMRLMIPVGFNHHREPHLESKMPDPDSYGVLDVVQDEFQKARYSLGTLGGGNHFIEVQRGSDGFIWIMIHSGSRNLGKQVADRYNKTAMALNARWHTAVPKEWELAFLPMDSDEGQQYLAEMRYCVDFALANRKTMMSAVIDAFEAEGLTIPHNLAVLPGEADYFVNIAHNYAAMENHFGQNVLVHRKGATRARAGEVGIIPGSQGTKSYIVRGKGNRESFESCSHGAGRKMGRKQAQRELSLDDERAALDAKGILHSVRHKDDLDEAPGAYKPIEVVMANQADLVDILVELSPLAVLKG